MNTITRKAYAKVNLALDVVGVRPNGYHEVKMIMQNVGIYDTLTFTKREDSQIVVETEDCDIPVNEDNLVCKAVRLLRELTGDESGVTISITKQIPIAGGMAGGSTDAAAALWGVNELLGLGLSEETLVRESVKIGADVPFCVMAHTALCEGIGEILSKVEPPPQAYIVVAKPDLFISTPTVYKKLDAITKYEHPDIDGMLKAMADKDLYGMAERLGNVLQLVTEKEFPVISQLKEIMMQNGALNALMSGSGPSTFGIFDSKEKAQKAYDEIEKSGLARQYYLTTFV